MATPITLNLVAGEGLENAVALIRSSARTELREAYDTLSGGIGGGGSPPSYYMRAWNLNTADWEVWKSVGQPSTSPPSGDPVVGLSISAHWE